MKLGLGPYEERSRRLSGSGVSTGRFLKHSGEGWRLGRACRRQDVVFLFAGHRNRH